MVRLKKGKNVIIKEGVIIGNNVVIEDNVYIDFGCIIRDNVHIKSNSYIGVNCILGEYIMDFYKDRENNSKEKLVIGKNAVLKSENIIYSGTFIDDNLKTGNKVVIREGCRIGKNVTIDTLSNIQHNVILGNNATIGNKCFICEDSIINNNCKIGISNIFTNDMTPPSEYMMGAVLDEGVEIYSRSIVLPGVKVGKKLKIFSGSLVTKKYSDGGVIIKK